MARSAIWLLVGTLAGAAAAQVPDAEVKRLDAALKASPEAGYFQLLDAALGQWEQVHTYRAEFHRQERRGGSEKPEEILDYKFHRDHGVRMRWIGTENNGQEVLYVQGKYENLLSIKAKFFFWVHLTKKPNDPDVLKNSNHTVLESGFGKSLENIRSLSRRAQGAGDLEIRYEGLKPGIGPDGQRCFEIVRKLPAGKGYPNIRMMMFFDAATLMPVKLESYDPKGHLETYWYKKVKLNPQVSGRPELTVRDFYRSVVFPNQWEKRENWPGSDVCGFCRQPAAQARPKGR